LRTDVTLDTKWVVSGTPFPHDVDFRDIAAGGARSAEWMKRAYRGMSFILCGVVRESRSPIVCVPKSIISTYNADDVICPTNAAAAAAAAADDDDDDDGGGGDGDYQSPKRPPTTPPSGPVVHPVGAGGFTLVENN